MKEWKEYSLDEICTDIFAGGDAKKLNPTKEKTNNNKIPIYANSVENEGLYGYCQIPIISKPAITIAARGAGTGFVAYREKPFTPIVRLITLVTKNIVDTKFLYYNLKNKGIKGDGSAIPQITIPMIKKEIVSIPNIHVQKKIAGILSPLDDKIKLNCRINENLEQQVQALFKSWFVDFVPFKDGKFVDSELGKIPEGWKVGTIGDYCKIRSGFAFKSSWWTDKGVKVVKIKNISSSGNLDMNDCSYVNKENTLKAKEFSLKPGDLLIAMTGATIGKFCLVPILKERMYVNQRVGKFFLGENPILKVPFIYGLLKRENIISQIINKGQGSAQPNISANDIESIPIILPTKEIISKYNEMVSPYFSLLIKELNECDYLANLRDTLLPKLMSGELKLSE
jgi:type I restriction enzyme S subunit